MRIDAALPTRHHTYKPDIDAEDQQVRVSILLSYLTLSRGFVLESMKYETV